MRQNELIFCYSDAIGDYFCYFWARGTESKTRVCSVEIFEFLNWYFYFLRLFFRFFCGGFSIRRSFLGFFDPWAQKIEREKHLGVQRTQNVCCTLFVVQFSGEVRWFFFLFFLFFLSFFSFFPPFFFLFSLFFLFLGFGTLYVVQFSGQVRWSSKYVGPY